MKLRLVTVFAGSLASILLMSTAPVAYAAGAERCDMAWSRYTGWEPFGYMQDKGLADKWGSKYKVKLKFTYVNSYTDSIGAFAGGAYDGLAVTNMDALTGPAVGGIDTTFLVVGDFSNGNDGILIRGATPKKGPNGKEVAPPKLTLANLKGKKVQLVDGSVSQYLLSRALAKNELKETDVGIISVSDADIGSLMATASEGSNFATWNPMLLEARSVPGIQMVFDSSQIPGEIIDALVVRTDASDACKKAATGAWYEAMSVMSGAGKESADMIKYMAAQAGGTEAMFRQQLRTTRMFYQPAEAITFTAGPELQTTMKFVAKFSAEHKLGGLTSATAVGIQFPDGSVWGDEKNIKLRFDNTYMQLAKDGKL